MLSRLDKSPVATWWWTVDRWFLAAFLSLMGLGIVLSFAASPAVAERIGLDSFHFATRQIVFMIPALIAMISVSFMSARQIRRFSLFLLGLMLVMMVAVLFVGVEVKGETWSCVEIPGSADFFGTGKTVRVDAVIDAVKLENIGAMVTGTGGHMVSLNAKVRKALGKDIGDTVAVTITKR